MGRRGSPLAPSSLLDDCRWLGVGEEENERGWVEGARWIEYTNDPLKQGGVGGFISFLLSAMTIPFSVISVTTVKRELIGSPMLRHSLVG